MQKRKQFKSASAWATMVEQCRISGLPARRWCQQNAVPYTTFMGWRTRLQNKPSTTPSLLSTSSFVEIVEEPTETKNTACSGVVVEFQGVHIHLSREFDSAVLQSCIKALKEVACYR